MGILSAKATVAGEDVVCRVESTEYASLAAHLIREFYGTEPKIAGAAGGGRVRVFTFHSKSAVRYLDSLDGDAADPSLLFVSRCDGCRQAFLRGVFLAAGRLSDPSKQYCLEFSVENRKNIFLQYFASLGLTLRCGNRSAHPFLYTKNSTTIEDFFALSGQSAVTFAVINRKIETDFRANANRLANCETGNITKAVAASMKQIALLRELESNGLLTNLPPELEYTARLRLDHVDLSLAQLSALTVPKVSKPGLSHRLARICALGEELLRRPGEPKTKTEKK